MSTPLIGASEYPSIRAAISLELDSVALPDSIIALPIYIGAGINEVISRVPSAESLTGSALQRVQNAAVFFTASYLAPVIQSLVSEREGDITLQYDRKNMIDLATSLRARAIIELDAVTSGQVFRPIFFKTIAGRRGA